MEKFSSEYPNVIFLQFLGNNMNDKNLDKYFGAIEEPRFLSAMVAALTTKTNKIRFVGAFPQTKIFVNLNAFAQGAKYVNPDVEISAVWTNSCYDPAKEEEATLSLIDSVCDVISQHCDSAGPTIAAQEKGVYSIGYNSEVSASGKDAFLTSVVWNHGLYYNMAVEQILNGTYRPMDYYGGLKDGYVDILPLSKNAPSGIQKKIDEARARIIAGELAPFTGPIKDQNGNLVAKDGEVLTREQIWQMDYLVEGINGSIN